MIATRIQHRYPSEPAHRQRHQDHGQNAIRDLRDRGVPVPVEADQKVLGRLDQGAGDNDRGHRCSHEWHEEKAAVGPKLDEAPPQTPNKATPKPATRTTCSAVRRRRFRINPVALRTSRPPPNAFCMLAAHELTGVKNRVSSVRGTGV